MWDECLDILYKAAKHSSQWNWPIGVNPIIKGLTKWEARSIYWRSTNSYSESIDYIIILNNVPKARVFMKKGTRITTTIE